jgi:hypothetical protein
VRKFLGTLLLSQNHISAGADLQQMPCSTCIITDFYHCFVLARITARLYLPLVADRWLPLGLPRIENRRSQICASGELFLKQSIDQKRYS